MKSKLAVILSHPVQYYSPLFKYLSKQGIDLKVFYAFKPNDKQQGKVGFGKSFNWDIDLLEGYEYEFLKNVSKDPGSHHFSGCDTPMIGQKLEVYNPSHILSFGWHLKSHRQALKYAKQNSVSFAVKGDSQLDPELPLWKRLVKKVYYPFFLQKFDVFLSVGHRNKAYLGYYGVSEEKIIFSPHSIDQSFWKEVPVEKSKDFTFLWVAKFIEKKRPFDVIEAFKRMLQALPINSRVKIRMVGSGPLLENAKAKAIDFDQIEFPGFKNQKELKNEYSNANCLILSSNYQETWGLVVNEAFSMGLPAIVSDACGCSADLINQHTGSVYPMGDVKALQDAILSTYDSFNETEIQRKQALMKMNRQYSFESIESSIRKFMAT